MLVPWRAGTANAAPAPWVWTWDLAWVAQPLVVLLLGRGDQTRSLVVVAAPVARSPKAVHK